MPWYHITITLTDKSSHQGDRHSEQTLDEAFLLFKKEAEAHYGRHNIEYFNCLAYSKYSEEAIRLSKGKKQKSKETLYIPEPPREPIMPRSKPTSSFREDQKKNPLDRGTMGERAAGKVRKRLLVRFPKQ